MAPRSIFLLLYATLLNTPSLEALPLRPAADPPPLKVEPIPQAEDAFLEKDVQAEIHAWRRGKGNCTWKDSRKICSMSAWPGSCSAL